MSTAERITTEKMRIKRNGEFIDVTAVHWDSEKKLLKLIDQRKLPQELEFMDLHDAASVFDAIRNMVVRGAPAIGLTGVYGLLLELNRITRKNPKPAELEQKMHEVFSMIASSRPTAIDLKNLMEEWLLHVRTNLYDTGKAEEYAQHIFERNKQECFEIGVHGSKLFFENAHVLTHCNAGALATADYGTALAPMRVAKTKKITFHIWVGETRPRLQGARLTAWELANEDISHKIIVDSSATFLMSEGMVDFIIVGADRITGDGWVANKIGTLSLAISASYFGVPFYVAIPWSTFAPNTERNDNDIEYRNQDEVLRCPGTQNIANPSSNALNPAFDWMPEDLVTGFITSKGILEYEELFAKKPVKQG